MSKRCPMLKSIKSKASSAKGILSSGFKSIGEGLSSIVESFSTFSIWPNTSYEDYIKGSQEYVRKSKAYARKVGIKENDYIFKNPYLERMGKHNLSGLDKDKEAMQKDKEAIFGKENANG